MKRIVFVLLTILGVITSASAQTVTVADVTATPGQEVTATLKLACPEGIYTGIQFEMAFPETGFTVGADATSGWKGSIENGSMTNGVVKFAAAVTNPFSSADIAVKFTVGANVAEGSYDVTVGNIRFEGSSNTTISDVTFKVNVANKMEGCEVTATDVEAVPGETVKTTLKFVCPADIFTGLQFNMQFPESGFSVGEVTGWNGSIEKGIMDAGLIKFAAARTQNFSEANIEMEIIVDESVATGEYEVTIKDVRYEGSANSTADEYTFKVNVVESHVAELDADVDGDFNQWIADNNGKTVDVKIKRTLPADEWSTLVLPFAMKLKQVQTVFGKKVKIADFDNAADEVENEKVTGIDINFKEQKALMLKIEANVPVIIKVDGEEDTYKGSIEVSGVQVTKVSYTDENQSFISEAIASFVDEDYAEDYLLPIKFDKNLTSDDYENASVNALIGTYKSIKGIGDYTNDFYIKGNKFWHANSAKSKPTRAYFCMEKSEYKPAGSDLPVRMIIHTDDEATGIKSVKEVVNLGGAVYNLQGQRVESVKKGLYIQNGKKYFVK